MPARCSASVASSLSVSASFHTSPRPIKGRHICARGARSPEAPTLPRLGTQGVRPICSKVSNCLKVVREIPDWPRPSAWIFSCSIRRVISGGTGSPTPHAWLRSRFCCSAVSCSSSILLLASTPKPVLMPYRALPSSRACNTMSRLRMSAAWSLRRDSMLAARSAYRVGIRMVTFMCPSGPLSVSCNFVELHSLSGLKCP